MAAGAARICPIQGNRSTPAAHGSCGTQGPHGTRIRTPRPHLHGAHLRQPPHRIRPGRAARPRLRRRRGHGRLQLRLPGAQPLPAPVRRGRAHRQLPAHLHQARPRPSGDGAPVRGADACAPGDPPLRHHHRRRDRALPDPRPHVHAAAGHAAPDGDAAVHAARLPGGAGGRHAADARKVRRERGESHHPQRVHRGGRAVRQLLCIERGVRSAPGPGAAHRDRGVERDRGRRHAAGMEPVVAAAPQDPPAP